MKQNFVLKGDICYSKSPQELACIASGYLVCKGGESAGVFAELPEKYRHFPLYDYTGKLIIPGLCDLHMHAPQFAFRALGMDLELLEWLDRHTFQEEAKYNNIEYAVKAYTALVDALRKGPNTRICLFATVHLPATNMLMEMLDQAGLQGYVGKVNMDRNSNDALCEGSAEKSLSDTRRWLEACAGGNIKPILTPRFIPSCSDALLRGLAALQKEFALPVQSHMSENQSEVAWVKELCPGSASYGAAYDDFGLFGGDVPTVMAHCVWPEEEEIALLRDKGVFIAHCPQSNMNLSSGIAPARRYLDEKIPTGLGSDVAGGSHSSIFRAMSDAIQASKMRWRLVNQEEKPLTVEEAFYLGTLGGGKFFGKVGSFDEGYAFDALVLDDAGLAAPFELTMEERLTRVIYLSDDRHIMKKYAGGKPIC